MPDMETGRLGKKNTGAHDVSGGLVTDMLQ